MSRHLTVSVTLIALVIGSSAALGAQRGRGSVSSARGTYSHSGNTGSVQGQRASGSRTVNQTSSGATATRQAQTQSGATRSTTRDVDAENREIDKTTTTTTAWGESGTRSREVEGHGGYATIEGSARTSTGRSASGEGVAGRTYYGQPAVAGTVNTKYNGTYSAAAARTPYGGWNTAAAGPYGGRVTTTLPSGYRTATYYGRPYYTYGGAYYRPYTYGGVHYYYPVPPPYYSYYSYPPPGATILDNCRRHVPGVAGRQLLQADDDQRREDGVPGGARAAGRRDGGAAGDARARDRRRHDLLPQRQRVLPARDERRAGSFVVVTAPAGVVFVAALPANFEVVHLNTMYFKAGGRYYVPYLSPDGAEMYVMVDTPPTPSTGAAPAAPAKAPAPAAPAAAKAPTSAPYTTPDTSGRPCPCGGGAPRGACGDGPRGPAGHRSELRDRAGRQPLPGLSGPGRRRQRPHDRTARHQGVRRGDAVDSGSKMKGQPTLSVTLTDMQVGGRVLPIKTQPLNASGGTASGAKKLVGGAAVGATIGAIAGGGEGAAIGAAVGTGVGGAAAAASSVKPAVIAAQTPQAFTLAVPLQLEITTNVAVR